MGNYHLSAPLKNVAYTSKSTTQGAITFFLAIFHDRFSITGLVFSGRHVMAVKENAQVWILEQ